MGTEPKAIKSSLYTDGPMETRFDVYEDFMHYSGGVYKYTYGSRRGGHAIKVIGWGNEGGLDYWLCANSWGDKWGLEGYFKIAWKNCGIDSTVMGCTPDLASPFMSVNDIFLQ